MKRTPIYPTYMFIRLINPLLRKKTSPCNHFTLRTQKGKKIPNNGNRSGIHASGDTCGRERPNIHGPESMGWMYYN